MEWKQTGEFTLDNAMKKQNKKAHSLRLHAGLYIRRYTFGPDMRVIKITLCTDEIHRNSVDMARRS